MARVKLSVGHDLATELGGDRDAVLNELAQRAGVSAYLRGNELTLDGDEPSVEQAKALIDELAGLVDQGISVGPQTVDAVAGVLGADGKAVDVLHDVVWRHRGQKVTPKTLGQKRYVDAIRGNTVTFGIGPAGTGKTYLAIALAVAALSEREVARIILTRPAVEAGERLGFLPGDLQAKVDPYLRPLFDALHDMLDADRLPTYMEKGMVEVAPLAFMRGRTLNDSFIILDEAQNTSPEQMQMFLTRLGFGSRVVVTGDITQIDLPRGPALRPGARDGGARRRARHLVRPLRRRRRRPPQAGAADRQRLHAGTAASGRGAARSERRGRGRQPQRLAGRRGALRPMSCAAALAGEGVDDGEVGVAFVPEREMAALNLEHRGGRQAHRRALVSARRLDDDLPPGCRGSWATSSSARRSPGATARRSRRCSSTARCTWSDMTTRRTTARMLARQDELLAGVGSVGAAPA